MSTIKKFVFAAIIGIGVGAGSATAYSYECEDLCIFEAQACIADGNPYDFCRGQAIQCRINCWTH